MRDLTREAFVRGYAERSGLSAKWAALGFIDGDGAFLIALPCDCGDDSCEGWAMVGPGSVNSHLELYAPAQIRDAMQSILRAKEDSA